MAFAKHFFAEDGSTALLPLKTRHKRYVPKWHLQSTFLQKTGVRLCCLWKRAIKGTSPNGTAAKAAISNFTAWLATHFSTTGIRVNALAPGFFLTNQNKDLLTNPDGTYTPRSEKIIAGTPMKKFGVPEDLLGGLLFLLSKDAAGFITGVVLPIDGGFNAYCGV